MSFLTVAEELGISATMNATDIESIVATVRASRVVADESWREKAAGCFFSQRAGSWRAASGTARAWSRSRVLSRSDPSSERSDMEFTSHGCLVSSSSSSSSSRELSFWGMGTATLSSNEDEDDERLARAVGAEMLSLGAWRSAGAGAKLSALAEPAASEASLSVREGLAAASQPDSHENAAARGVTVSAGLGASGW